MIITGMVATASAQETIYMIKGDKVVAKMNAEDVDYISFELPDGVKDQEKVAIEVNETGKNYITYSVTTANQNTTYAHMVIDEPTLNIFLQSYYDTTIDQVVPEVLEACLRMCMTHFGYAGQGNATYRMQDNEDDGSGHKFNIVAGLNYYLAVCELNNDDTLGETMKITDTATKKADVSAGNVSVSYKGQNEAGQAMFDFNGSDDILRIYTLYGHKDVMEAFIQIYGYEYTMFAFGQVWTLDELKNDPNGWQVDEETDYAMYILGVDANGDWAKDETFARITPIAQEKEGPKISIFSKSKGEGKVSVNFEITPSNVTEAYVRLMNETNLDDRLNMGYTLADLAAGGDATDVTSDINKFGEYTYTNNEVPNEWMSLLIMAKNEDGTTVTRMNFHAHLDGSQWAINENINVPATSAAKKHITSKNNMPAARKLNKAPKFSLK